MDKDFLEGLGSFNNKQEREREPKVFAKITLSFLLGLGISNANAHEIIKIFQGGGAGTAFLVENVCNSDNNCSQFFLTSEHVVKDSNSGERRAYYNKKSINYIKGGIKTVVGGVEIEDGDKFLKAATLGLPVEVSVKGTREYELISMDKGKDLALIVIKNVKKSEKPYQLSKDIKVNKEAQITGYSGWSTELDTKEGVVIGKNYGPGEYAKSLGRNDEMRSVGLESKNHRTSSLGQSGGPLLQDGKVIGVLSESGKNGKVSWGTRADQVKEFLAESVLKYYDNKK